LRLIRSKTANAVAPALIAGGRVLVPGIVIVFLRLLDLETGMMLDAPEHVKV
jgi:hypothetical protein